MALDLSLLKRLAKDEVIRHVETGHDDKDMVIEASLLKPLERIIGFSTLKERGINKIFKLEPFLTSKAQNIVYAISAQPDAVKHVINHIKADYAHNVTRNRWILFYPGKNVVVEYLLETEGVIGDVMVEDLALNFIPLETEVLSMECPSMFRELFIHSSHIPLTSIARALLGLQSVFGVIPSVYTVGAFSARLLNALKALHHDTLPSVANVPPEIGHLIVIDRNIDPFTVCSSQLTFEGLLSEVFSIKSGFIELEKGKFLLNDLEPIFNEIRNYQLNQVVPVIKENIKRIQNTQAKGKELTSVSDMRDFVSFDLKMIQKQRQILMTYLNCTERIIQRKKESHFHLRRDVEECLRADLKLDHLYKYVEWEIVCQKDVLTTLKLLCLYSYTSSAKVEEKQHLMQLFLESYGFHHLSTLANLERSRFFTSHRVQKRSTYKNLINDFDMVPSNSETPNPNDISSVFNYKYRPLSSQIVDKILAKQFSELNCAQYFSPGIQCHLFCDPEKIPEAAKNVYAVLYLGGVTHAEISCLRILARKYNKKIITMTTAIINGSDLMQTHIDQI